MLVAAPNAVAASLATSRLLLAIALAPMGALAQAPDLVGDWTGALDLGGTRLPIVFHITADDEGFAATMDSPDQGAFGVPAGRPSAEGDRVTIAVAAVGGSWTGSVAGDTLAGEWTQGGRSLPLLLVRGGDPIPPPARPQHPEPPFPYDVEEVRYPVPGAGVELAGTLTLPRGEGPFAAALLITGSGPQTRDEEVMGHRVFAVLADALTRAGIAVLRVDDRGVGESTGDFAAATSDDFARDAAAGVSFLKDHARIDPQGVGLVGHSEGGLVAPMVAAEVETAFSVLLAGPAVNGEEVLVAQSAHMQRAQGVPAAQVEANGTAIRAVARILRERPREVWADEVREALMASVPAGVPEAQAAQVRAAVDGQVQSFVTPWMARFVAYDPRPALEALDGPVLALFGALDAQVLPAQNLAPMREALAHNPQATVEVLEGLNHLFQPAGSGLPTEYAGIETTVDPAALGRVATWIVEVTR